MNVVKTGQFLYDGTLRCPLRIVETDWRPGSGDDEDPPAVRDDQAGIWFRVDLTYPGSPDVWREGAGGYFETCPEATRRLSERLASIF